MHEGRGKKFAFERAELPSQEHIILFSFSPIYTVDGNVAAAGNCTISGNKQQS